MKPFRGGRTAAILVAALSTTATGCYTSRFEQLDSRMAELQTELRRLALEDSIASTRLDALEKAAVKDDEARRAARAESASRHDDLIERIENLRSTISDSRDRGALRGGGRAAYDLPPSPGPGTLQGAPPGFGSPPATPGTDGTAGNPPAGDPSLSSPGTAESPGTQDAGGTTPGAGVPDPAEIRAAYDAARLDLTRGKFELAANGFREFLAQYPQAELADNAQYWLGECYYAQDRYEEAAAEFGKVLDLYPSGDKVPAAMLKLGFAEIALGRKDDGTARLEDLVRKYPGTPESRQAGERLRETGRTKR